MGDNDVLELKTMVKEMQRDVKNIDKQVTTMQNTVDLLVEGKIKTSKANDKDNDGTMAKVTVAAMEITRMAVAALTGYFAGRGGGS